ncbi:hypothetical protein RF11_16132 [Thelohanellus kitauei]|uniref:Uncharacterized protein n=1 Tax=Thelohanellus kitauei TaxID=669202 RepID=A0A0C2N2L1_THEKT|nr:hypothetical protein RF11_16132 [Thelohanellus kitauei]
MEHNVTLSQWSKMNVSNVFVISDVTESNTNRRIIVPMADYKPFIDLIDHILSIRIDTKDMNKVNICGFPNPQKMKIEDGRNFYYIICVNDEIYYVTIYQIEERRHTFLTIDFTSLKSVQLSIKVMEIYFRDLIPENSCLRNLVNLDSSYPLIGNSIFGSAENDSESNA